MLTMSTRFVALVDKPDAPVETRQFRGLPPDFTQGVDHREALPWPRVLVIEKKPDGIFLFRLTEDGTCVGDTWHMSPEEAQAQAEAEYGTHLSGWKDVPEAVDDPLTYALEKA